MRSTRQSEKGNPFSAARRGEGGVHRLADATSDTGVDTFSRGLHSRQALCELFCWEPIIVGWRGCSVRVRVAAILQLGDATVSVSLLNDVVGYALPGK